MNNFNLKPCPMCGGEPVVQSLVWGNEMRQARIKCRNCGLSLEWATNIRVGISLSGKRTALKEGLDPFEAWNRRHDCKTLDDVKLWPDTPRCLPICEKCPANALTALLAKAHDCNDCGANPGCQYMPQAGQLTRFNCPHWEPKEDKE